MCVSKTLGEKLQCLLSESIDVKIKDIYQPSLAQADQVPADAEGPGGHLRPAAQRQGGATGKKVAEHKSHKRSFSSLKVPTGAFVDPSYVQECLDSVLRVIRSVNDSLHQVNILHLPALLQPLGSLICQVRHS